MKYIINSVHHMPGLVVFPRSYSGFQFLFFKIVNYMLFCLVVLPSLRRILQKLENSVPQF